VRKIEYLRTSAIKKIRVLQFGSILNFRPPAFLETYASHGESMPAIYVYNQK